MRRANLPSRHPKTAGIDGHLNMALIEARRLFNVDEYYRMADAGILTEDDRVELIEGEIIEMSPIGDRHAACVDGLTKLLVQRVRDAAIVRVQNPIRLSDLIEPQPDLGLLRPRDDFYARGHPRPEDVFLIVEVAETSLNYDRDLKVPLYASAGIPEVWLVDLPCSEIWTYSQPESGADRMANRVGRGGSITSNAIPELTVEAGEILG
jgi:Uma2 family endonuclease